MEQATSWDGQRSNTRLVRLNGVDRFLLYDKMKIYVIKFKQNYSIQRQQTFYEIQLRLNIFSVYYFLPIITIHLSTNDTSSHTINVPGEWGR